MQDIRHLAGLVSAALVFTAFAAPPARSEEHEKISDAINRGVSYLIGELARSQTLSLRADERDGQVALETYALIVAGVSTSHPLIKRNFTYLENSTVKRGHTYGLALYVFALDAAIAQEESDLLLENMDTAGAPRKFKDNFNIGREYRQQLHAALSQLVSTRQAGGGWNYYAGGGKFDNSNTQFAVLALGVALKRNIPIDVGVWEKIVEHFVKGQQKEKGEEVKDRLTLMTDDEVIDRRLKGTGEKERSVVEVVKKEGEEKSEPVQPGPSDDTGKNEQKKGLTGVARKGKSVGPNPEIPSIGTESVPVFRRGWDYTNKGNATWNMTCAGLSSLLLAREALKGRIPPSQIESINAAVRDGYGWIMSNWTTGNDYYGMYSLEKVADIGEVKKFGAHDWYAEVSAHLLGTQQGDGSWSGGGDALSASRRGTAFALLILNRATRLVMMSLIGQDPLEKIVISGKKSTGDPGDHSWVYVPELNTTIHYPTLLRRIRLRAHPKFMRFLKSVVENYPEESRGELIPELEQLREEVLQNNDVRKALEEHLSEITGFRYKNANDYMKWFARWERVRLIGASQKTERVPDLLTYYEHTKRSVPLKKTIMWALVQCKAREALPIFLADLKNPDARVRAAAYNSFRAFFIDFPPAFDPLGSDSLRSTQIDALKAWFQEQLKSQ